MADNCSLQGLNGFLHHNRPKIYVLRPRGAGQGGGGGGGTVRRPPLSHHGEFSLRDIAYTEGRVMVMAAGIVDGTYYETTSLARPRRKGVKTF